MSWMPSDDRLSTSGVGRPYSGWDSESIGSHADVGVALIALRCEYSVAPRTASAPTVLTTLAVSGGSWPWADGGWRGRGVRPADDGAAAAGTPPSKLRFCPASAVVVVVVVVVVRVGCRGARAACSVVWCHRPVFSAMVQGCKQSQMEDKLD